jgi:putative NADH-flavin reductase
MSTQKIALFGASGEAGRQLAEEALRRGHNVTAIVRDETEFKLKHPNLRVVRGDTKKADDITRYAKGHDVVVGFHVPSKENPHEHVEYARNFIEGTKKAGVQHLVTVGHTFGKLTEGTQAAYDAYKQVTQAQNEALKLFRNEKELNWSYVMGAQPERREDNGKYQMSSEIRIVDPMGEQKVQATNFTEVLMDEAEKGTPELHSHEDEEL